MCLQVTHSQDLNTLPPTQSSAPDSFETLDMEAEMLRLDIDLHNPHKVPESNHYLTPNQHLRDSSMSRNPLSTGLVLLTRLTLIIRDRRRNPDSM